MEQYKDKLKLQNIATALCCVLLAFFTVLGFLGELGIVSLSPVAGDSHWQSRWRGFISGASFGILALMLFFLVRNLRAMKDEKKLRQLYIRENDERSIQIWTAARAASMQIFLMAGLVACIIAGYFSVTVCITILICVLTQSLLGMAFKVYYSKKF